MTNHHWLLLAFVASVVPTHNQAQARTTEPPSALGLGSEVTQANPPPTSAGEYNRFLEQAEATKRARAKAAEDAERLMHEGPHAEEQGISGTRSDVEEIAGEVRREREAQEASGQPSDRGSRIERAKWWLEDTLGELLRWWRRVDLLTQTAVVAALLGLSAVASVLVSRRLRRRVMPPAGRVWRLLASNWGQFACLSGGGVVLVWSFVTHDGQVAKALVGSSLVLAGMALRAMSVLADRQRS